MRRSNADCVGPVGPELLAAIEETFPHCPRSLGERFLEAALTAASEPLAAAARITLEKPYGRNHILWVAADHAVSFAQLEPGHSTSLHYHRQRREFFCVRAGRVRVESGGETIDLSVGEWGRSTPLVEHRVANGGNERAEIVEMFSPALLNDKYRVSDPYGRSLGSVGLRE